MGVLNVTPDSFSDGGRFVTVDDAVAHGLALAASGASIIDVGGESSRPGARPVAADEELARVVPVIEGLASRVAIPISIDTTKSVVADAALRAGASIVNDISGAEQDAAMFATVVRHSAGIVLMHKQGAPPTMQLNPQYRDVVREVGSYLATRVASALIAGVERSAIIADPGIGFGKTFEHNLQLLGGLGILADAVEVPVLVGTSRKGFLGAILTGAPVGEREDATLATTVFAFMQGAAIVRVHNVDASVAAARVLESIAAACRNAPQANASQANAIEANAIQANAIQEGVLT